MEWYNPYTSSPYWVDEEKEGGEVVAWCDLNRTTRQQEKNWRYSHED